MNEQDNFQIPRDERTKLVNRAVELKSEIAHLREAVKHLEHCRECAEVGFCRLGRQHNDFLSSLNERKAV